MQPVRLYPIVMSILLYSYKQQLMGCISEVEQMMVKVQGLQKITALDHNKNYVISKILNVFLFPRIKDMSTPYSNDF